MIKHDFVVEIRAPLEKVFAFTTDFRNLTTWQEGLSEASQLPDGPTQPDTRFRLVSTFLGECMQAAGEVTEFASNHKLAFKTTSSPIQLNVTAA
ncbi:MAG: SRPBCC family protein, partial [Chloroflexota bacterium]